MAHFLLWILDPPLNPIRWDVIFRQMTFACFVTLSVSGIYASTVQYIKTPLATQSIDSIWKTLYYRSSNFNPLSLLILVKSSITLKAKKANAKAAAKKSSLFSEITDVDRRKVMCHNDVAFACALVQCTCA